MMPVALLVPLALSLVPQDRPLKGVLAEISRKAEVQAVTVKSLESISVSPPSIEGITRENVEDHLLALVKKLPVPSRMIRLNLPKSDRQWTADEILAYGRAEANLFKKGVGEIKPGTVEVLGVSVPDEKARPVVEALNLRPVYVILPAQAQFGGTWQTTYGSMILTQKGTRVTGTYSTNGGQITGDVVGNELRFIWFEQNGSGGRGVYVLGDDGMSFSGPWYTHENPDTPAGTWTGRRAG